jgi:hypothetical protein
MINTYIQKFGTKYVSNIGFNIYRTRFRECCWREIRYRRENLVENYVNEGYRERRLEIASRKRKPGSGGAVIIGGSGGRRGRSDGGGVTGEGSVWFQSQVRRSRSICILGMFGSRASGAKTFHLENIPLRSGMGRLSENNRTKPLASGALPSPLVHLSPSKKQGSYFT